jgi:hypothetical protein
MFRREDYADGPCAVRMKNGHGPFVVTTAPQP